MIEEMLSRVPLFEALPPSEIHYLAQNLHLRDVPPDTVLFLEGDPGDRLSIILEGEVHITKAMETGDEWTLAVIGPGEFMGEMSLLYRERLRSANARTLTEVRLLELTQADFDALLRRQPKLAFRIMQEMSVRLRNSEAATIRDLQEKNTQLAQAYQELKAAQEQLIEKEKLEHELRMARKIQEQILPKEIPSVPGWRLAAYWQPARSVSGDFYDFISFPDGKLGLVVGDVTDKGVPAALVMATTRSVLRGAAVISRIQQGEISPGTLLAQVNDLLYPDMPVHMFVTCLLAVLDPTSGHIRFANAGHSLPYQHAGERVLELRATGMPLGLMPGMKYDEQETVLAPGDSLLLYSDGLIEAHNPQGEMFGTPRLASLLSKQAGGAASIEFLLNQLAEFTGPNWEQEDDVTFVTLERFPKADG